jgi:ParB/RepB/Spo0J family partition protein
MRQLKRVQVSDLRADPNQPRKRFEEATELALAQNLKQFGLQVPLIVFDGMILDGERRWRAAQLVGITELEVIELTTRPTATELRLLQMSLDAHRANLTAIERSDFLVRMKAENNWSITDLAEKLSMKQPLVSKLLKYQDACEELRAALGSGQIDQDKAYTICQEPDHHKQRELLDRSGDLTREQLRQATRHDGQPVELKTMIARFLLPANTVVTVQAKRKLSASDLISALSQTVKELKAGQASGLDVLTTMHVMADRSRVTP